MFTERRSAVRYPLALNAHYQTLRKRSRDGGTGRTVDISSGGFLIHSQHPVPVGIRLEIAVEWPALLDGAIELMLVASGRVVRARDTSFALEFSWHEFRTTKRRITVAATGGKGRQSAAMATGASETSDVPTAMARFLVPELST
jgi:c-di-GMP-binding flagellar brake protein YcgR